MPTSCGDGTRRARGIVGVLDARIEHAGCEHHTATRPHDRALRRVAGHFWALFAHILPRMTRVATVALWLGCASAAACTDAADAADAGATTGGSVQFTRDVFPIVRERCAIAGCHVSGTTTNHFTDFSTAASTYLRWVNAPGFDFCSEPDGGIFVQRTIVVPFAPEQSYLVTKLTSTREELCPQLHSPRMPPPPMPPLTSEQIETIATWIREGALND